MYVIYTSRWRDLQFNDDFERQIFLINFFMVGLFNLRVFVTNNIYIYNNIYFLYYILLCFVATITWFCVQINVIFVCAFLTFLIVNFLFFSTLLFSPIPLFICNIVLQLILLFFFLVVVVSLFVVFQLCCIVWIAFVIVLFCFVLFCFVLIWDFLF